MLSDRRLREPIIIACGLLASVLMCSQLARAQAQNPYLGSVPAGEATVGTLDLSLGDALHRALKYNLGAIESDQDTRTAHAVRLRELNALLPDLSARISASREQINFKAQGLRISIPGVNIPTVVGPFGVTDARAYVSDVFNWSDLKNWKSSEESEKASRYSYQSDRDLVVFTAGTAYLIVISDSATLDSVRAQVKTAETLYQQDADQNKHGLIASIDVLRAEVEWETQRQRQIAAENQLNIDKLSLARIIGLPAGQQFRLSDSVPYAPLESLSLDQALQQAYATRPDYLGAKAQLQAAELALQASSAENYPYLSTAADYGDIGSPDFSSSHGTVNLTAALNIPIFQGSRVRADKLAADAVQARRKAELADLGGRIDDQVRTAFYNLKSSSDLVSVARSNMDLANRALDQARDRFASGVADNLEVVQAQESVASAEQSYIASLFAFNSAKISLAQALGIAEKSALQYLLGGK